MSFSASSLPQSFDFIKLTMGTKDFLLIDHWELEKNLQEEVYRRLCAHILPRFQGVGATSLLVLTRNQGPTPLLREFISSREITEPGFDAMTTAARYLFDTARYGIGSIPLETKSGKWALEPLDSHSFRLSLGSPLKMIAGVEVFFAAAETGAKPSPWKLRQKSSPRTGGPVPIRIQLIGPEEIKVQMGKGYKEGDMLEAAALGALAAFKEGFCGSQVVVRCRKTQVYVEITPQTEELKVTASAAYVFSGTYSWS